MPLACSQALRSGIQMGNMNTMKGVEGWERSHWCISNRGVCSQCNLCERNLRELSWEQRFDYFLTEEMGSGSLELEIQRTFLGNRSQCLDTSYLLPAWVKHVIIWFKTKQSKRDKVVKYRHLVLYTNPTELFVLNILDVISAVLVKNVMITLSCSLNI